MAAYKDLIGQKITKVTSNPSDPKTGQMWYNSTSGKLRGLGILSAWSSSAPLGRDAGEFSGGAGTQTAAMVSGGLYPEVNTTNEYNGTGWSTSGNMNTAGFYRGLGGTQTAGFCFGNQVASPDFPTGVSETYDGSSWTSISTIPQVHSQSASFGSTTAGVCSGGRYNNYDQATTVTNEWDGSSWSTGGAYPPTDVRGMACTSTSPATTGLAFGGQRGGSPSPGLVTNNQSYDGSTWTAQTAIPTATAFGAGSGTSTSALLISGNAPSATTNCFKYDGSSWTAIPSLATGRRTLSGLGSTTAALATAGSNSSGSDTQLTEEYNESTSVITAGAYSSGPTLDTNRRRGAGWGSMTSAVLAGGQNPGGLTSSSSEFDGSSWTAGGTMNSARQELGALGATESAGLVFGGEPNPLGTAVEYYNGSSWTNGTSFPTAMKFGRMHAGPNTAGIVSGGSTPTGSGGDDSNGNFHDSHDWNGSSWTANTDMPFANQGGSAGSQTATVQTGNGYLVSPTIRMLDWNGSSWTAGASAVAGTDAYLVVGTQAAFVMGTANPPKTLTQVGDGTTIATGPSFAVDKSSKSGIGSSSSLNGAGGGEPGTVDTFEEFTAETTAVNITDFTTS